MELQFCQARLKELTQLVHLHGNVMLSFCVSNLVFSFVAVLGNFLVIHALWKASLMPPTIKTLFLSLAISDLAVGILSQPMFGVIIAVMLRRLSNGQHNFALFCPTVLTVCYYFMFGLSFASFLNVIIITLDRPSRCSVPSELPRPCNVKKAYYSIGRFMDHKCYRYLHSYFFS